MCDAYTAKCKKHKVKHDISEECPECLKEKEAEKQKFSPAILFWFGEPGEQPIEIG